MVKNGTFGKTLIHYFGRGSSTVSRVGILHENITTQVKIAYRSISLMSHSLCVRIVVFSGHPKKKTFCCSCDYCCQFARRQRHNRRSSLLLSAFCVRCQRFSLLLSSSSFVLLFVVFFFSIFVYFRVFNPACSKTHLFYFIILLFCYFVRCKVFRVYTFSLELNNFRNAMNSKIMCKSTW